MKNRKATDVLIDLEKKVQVISSAINNIDNNVKIILDKLNNLNNQKPVLKPLEPKQSKPVVKATADNIPRDISSNLGNIYVAKSPPEEVFNDENNLELFEDFSPKGQRRTDRVKKNNDTDFDLITVSQKLILAGNPVFLAQVEIIDNSGDVIKRTRTNEVGRWVARIAPGTYKIHVLKRNSETKDLVESIYNIDISSSKTPAELPDFNL